MADTGWLNNTRFCIIKLHLRLLCWIKIIKYWFIAISLHKHVFLFVVVDDENMI